MPPEVEAPKAPEQKVAFKVIFSGKKYDVELPISSSIQDLKKHLTPIIGKYKLEVLNFFLWF